MSQQNRTAYRGRKMTVEQKREELTRFIMQIIREVEQWQLVY